MAPLSPLNPHPSHSVKTETVRRTPFSTPIGRYRVGSSSAEYACPVSRSARWPALRFYEKFIYFFTARVPFWSHLGMWMESHGFGWKRKTMCKKTLSICHFVRFEGKIKEKRVKLDWDEKQKQNPSVQLLLLEWQKKKILNKNKHIKVKKKKQPETHSWFVTGW